MDDNSSEEISSIWNNEWAEEWETVQARFLEKKNLFDEEDYLNATE